MFHDAAQAHDGDVVRDLPYGGHAFPACAWPTDPGACGAPWSRGRPRGCAAEGARVTEPPPGDAHQMTGVPHLRGAGHHVERWG
ncbi:hypothetical protein ACH41H_00790 [Streptomyces sp. NPDC020800]|uniref:hypothetical protein n=1 Tax=Streptomyces sp. NPDC020800 TaxID=3365092 RepID=UPI0037A9BD0D